MRFSILFDASVDAGLDVILDELDDGGFGPFFANRTYDNSDLKITLVLMCRGSIHGFKQRLRLSRKENKLYMDIMLELDEMSSADLETRKKIIAEKISSQLPKALIRKAPAGFDLIRFKTDLARWFGLNKWT